MSHLLLLLALPACQNDPDDAAAGLPDPVTTTIGPEGGTLDVEGEGGGLLTFDFPPGAVTEPFELTVTPEWRSDGELLRAAVSPRDMLFAEAVHVGVELPRDLAPTASSPLRFGGIFVASEVDVDAGRVDAELRLWGSLTTSPASPFARVAPSAPDTNGADATVEDELALIDKIEEARAMLDEMERGPDILLAVGLQGLLSDLAEDGSSGARTFLQEATDRACNGARDIQADLELAIDDFDQVQGRALPVAMWDAVVVAGKGGCDVPSAAEALAPLADSAGALYDAEAPTATPDGDDWDQLLDELDNNRAVGLQAEALGVEGVAPLFDALVDPMLASLRAPAWDQCRATGDQSALGELLAHAPGNAAVVRDLQSCGTQLGWDSREADGSGVASGTVQGVRPPGSPTLQAVVAARSDGSIQVSGSLRALTCEVGALDQEQLVVAIDGHEVTRLDPNNGEYLLGAPTFVVADLLATAGVQPDDETEHRLTFERQGTACGGAYGAPKYVVATLILQPGADGDMFGRYAQTSWSVSCSGCAGAGEILYGYGHQEWEITPTSVLEYEWLSNGVPLGAVTYQDPVGALPPGVTGDFTLTDPTGFAYHSTLDMVHNCYGTFGELAVVNTLDVTGTVTYADDGTATLTVVSVGHTPIPDADCNPVDSWVRYDWTGTKAAP